jgi:signal transduction histidine kinase/ligand-binding sensor domain-containing protein
VWQSPEGLPEDFAQALAQTPDGYLWIGTSGGLVRFDGVRFAVFNAGNQPAFRDDSVYSLFTARDGTLWAGTEGGGLVRYRAGEFHVFGAAEGLTDLFVRVVFEDHTGRLWIGTDGGLFRLDGDRFTRIDDHPGVPRMNVHSICEDRHGRLLVGGGGLLVLSDDRTRTRYYRSSGDFADNSIRTIRETHDGSIWIGTISGLRRLAGGLADNPGLSDNPFAAPRLIDGTNIAVLRESRNGQVWIGTYGRGLMRFDGVHMLTLSAPGSLPHDNVLAVFEDAEDNIWVGTQGGLLRLRPGAASTITAADGAPLSINTIYEDPRGPLLVTALNGRLFEVSHQALVPVDLPGGLSDLPIRNVFRDSKGRLWIGTDGRGVARIDGRAVVRYTMTHGLVNDFVRAFCEDREGGIWIGTDGGLSYWHAGAFRNFTTATGLVYSSIRGLLLDRAGDLWVATEGGLDRIHAGAVVRDPRLDPLRGHKVWALHEDPEGGLWIGTHGTGLFLLKAGGLADGRLTQFTTEHGLPSNKIHFIGEDPRGNLWMSGPRGVVSVSRRDLEGVRRDTSTHVAVRVYGTTEGLRTNQMNGGVQPAGVLTSTGDVWLPGTRGAVLIVPEAAERRSPAPLLIEQAIADGRVMPISASADLSVAPGEGKLEIQYTSIRLGAPERVRFKYWMEGFERDWTSAGERRVAYYTNLPAGDYRFHVVAYEMDAPQQATEAIVAVHLRPHFYRTAWFVALCAAIVATAGWGAYRLHVRSIRRQFAAVLEERSRLAREMHDTLIQGCVGVSTLLEAAFHAQDVSPAMGHDLLHRARGEVRAAIDEARLAVWNLRRGSTNGNGLVPAISALAHRIGLEAGLDIGVQTVGSPVALDGDIERSLTMLIREALQNAIRHAAPRTLSVVLRFERRQLRVEIIDDGHGFDSSIEPSKDAHHYGLLGMRERVEQAGGDFHVTSAPGNGTQVRLSIPVARRRQSARGAL